MTLFDYAIVYLGKKDKDTDDYLKDKEPRLVARDSILAADEAQAAVVAARAIPDDLIKELDRVSIAVRPF